MKSRQRFFNAGILCKDITRFAPVWILYLIGGLMIAVGTLAEVYGEGGAARAVGELGDSLSVFAVFNLAYAFIVAQMLYGDLFNSRMCNALHAMPLRRESWFVTHTLSGLLFSLVPNLVGSLCFLPFLGELWYSSFLWLLGMQLQYLFFFGVAVFCMYSTGSRFAAVVIYGILNFGAFLVLWFAETVYVPLMPGVRLEVDGFYWFVPLVGCINGSYFDGKHAKGCPCGWGDGNGVADTQYHIHEFIWQDGWGYVSLLAVLGSVFLGLALLLYRKRELESAGSFVAFKPMRPVFQVIFSLSAAGFCYMIPEMFMGGSEVLMFVFFFIGLAVGFYVSQMFIDRSIKVFRGKNFMRLGILFIVLVLSVLLTWLDPLGMTRYTPPQAQIERVYVLNQNASQHTLENIGSQSQGKHWLCTEDPALIEQVCEAHRLMAGQQTPERLMHQSSFTIHYQLKNGSVFTRSYSVGVGTPAYEAAVALLRGPEVIFGVPDLESLKARVISIKCEETGRSYPESLLDTLWQDACNGDLVQLNLYHWDMHRGYSTTLRLLMEDPATGMEYTCFLDVCSCTEGYRLIHEKN